MIVRWNSIIYIMLVWWGLYEWCYGYSFFWSQTHSDCIMYILTCPTYEWKNKTSTRSYTPRAQMKNPQQEAPALRKGCVLVSVRGTSFFSCVVVSDLQTIQPEQSSHNETLRSTDGTRAQYNLEPKGLQNETHHIPYTIYRFILIYDDYWCDILIIITTLWDSVD